VARQALVYRNCNRKLILSLEYMNSAGFSRIGLTVVLWLPLGPPQPQNLYPLHVPIVPMSVNMPVVVSTLYIETSFEPEFVT
jgi:hypothetical protein